MSLDVERLWGRRAELKAVHKGPASLRPMCDRVVAPSPRYQTTSLLADLKMVLYTQHIYINANLK